MREVPQPPVQDLRVAHRAEAPLFRSPLDEHL